MLRSHGQAHLSPHLPPFQVIKNEALSIRKNFDHQWFRCGRENQFRVKSHVVWKQVKVVQFPMTNADLFLRIFEAIPGTLKRFETFRMHFSSPEAALLLVSTKNHDLWPGPTPEVRDSRNSRYSAHAQSQVWQIWLVLVSIYCVYKAIQNRNVVDVVGPGQRSWFLVLTKRSAASGDENV